MGNKSSLLLQEEEIAQIQEETGCKYLFSKLQKFMFLLRRKICVPYFFLINQ